ncbi:MAG: hypothetical protein EOP00_33370 [Pedobacter sp.]|nr:MAG: hypothetical protein EOP00_33370 [Pedobacter sp.]
MKDKYPCFYKPGQKLLNPLRFDAISDRKGDLQIGLPKQIKKEEISYCLADTNLNSFHSNHYPFLLPYKGSLKENRHIKSKACIFVTKNAETSFLHLTSIQRQLNDIVFEMIELAPINSILMQTTVGKNINTTPQKRERALFTLWQKAISLVYYQEHQFYYFTYGMSNVFRKKNKKDIQQCKFSEKVPRLFFLEVDKGDYYQLELRFKIARRNFIPYEFNTAFFINSRQDPLTFYLLGSFAEYEVTSFFAQHKFKIAVLKEHYKNEFKDFVDRLRELYEVK